MNLGKFEISFKSIIIHRNSQYGRSKTRSQLKNEKKNDNVYKYIMYMFVHKSLGKFILGYDAIPTM